VKIHPAFTIMAIVAGELVWGVAGMVVAIPAIAIVKIVLDKIPELRAYGFLIGNEKE
jgi:predicted PurR-regulated permease PerM